uniref:Uncharacterized protein n=1 Tax=Plectus sambesii TaxID=2011161 RepID=A0A914UIR2_9BILA
MYDQDPGPMPRWPHLLLCVSSFDQWSRHRTEGYGCVALPTLPGQSTVTVHTWRPQHNRTSDLRRFFIGGSPELESIDLACVPNGHTGSRLSKVGLRTVSSGVVELKFRVVHQCRSYIAPERQRQIKYGALLERIGILIIQRGAPKSILLTSLHSTDTDHLLNQCSCFAFESHLVIADMIVFSASTTSGMHWSIIAVLDAFEKARRRMLHVRDNVFYTNKSFDQSSE